MGFFPLVPINDGFSIAPEDFWRQREFPEASFTNEGFWFEKVEHFGRVGSRNTSPSRQKVVKMKPRGLDEDTVAAATFGKPSHPDVQMEDGLWAMLPEGLLNEILARVPPFMIFRLRSICKRWNSILQERSFLKFHSQVPSHGPCLLTFWKNSQMPQCWVISLPLKTCYRIPFIFLPPWAFWLVGSSGGLICFLGLDGNF
uniref:F-box domain-containing protein n=1 Tax=Tarenaya spinosa TaxID=228870 RepID=Q1KUU4_9ROSI|nr:hypothetical protein [Tarenaya spinosa]